MGVNFRQLAVKVKMHQRWNQSTSLLSSLALGKHRICPTRIEKVVSSFSDQGTLMGLPLVSQPLTIGF